MIQIYLFKKKFSLFTFANMFNISMAYIIEASIDIALFSPIQTSTMLDPVRGKKTLHLIPTTKNNLSWGIGSQYSVGNRRLAHVGNATPRTRKRIVPAVLIYNTIKTHGKTVDAILVINQGSQQAARIGFCFNCVFCLAFDCVFSPVARGDREVKF